MNLSKESGFIQRMRKVSPISLLESVLFSNPDPSKVSLNDMAIYHHIHFGISLTRQAIAKRFNKRATLFLKIFLQGLLETTLFEGQPIFTQSSHFNKIKIKDSTCNQLPENLKEAYPGSGGAGSGAAVRVQFEFDLKNHEVSALDVSAFNKQDITDAKNTLKDIEENDLILRDMGYSCIGTIQGIEQRKAWYISRLNPNTSVFCTGTLEQINFEKIEHLMEKTGTYIIDKQVLLSEQHYPTRLVIEAVPEKVKQERIRKASKEAKKKGRQLSKEKKDRLGLNLFITNCPAKMLAAPELRRYYGIRWQVEIMFKAWKQNSQFHKIKKMDIDRYEFLLYAKLIWVLLSWKIYQVIDVVTYRTYRQRISVLKIFKTMPQMDQYVKGIFRGGQDSLPNLLLHLERMSRAHLLQDDRIGRINWRNVENI